MRLVTYDAGTGPRAGVLVREDELVDAAACADAAGLSTVDDRRFCSVRGLLATGAEALEALAEAVAGGRTTPLALDQVTLGPPVPDPDKIICLGLNYRDHAAEAGLPLPPAPMLFAKFRNSLVGPTAPVVLPAISEAVDFEAEVAVVIGDRAKDVNEADALAHVAGIMAFNDVTARDVQHTTSQWTAGKAIDTFAPCGPALVLMDEVDDLQRLRLATRVNGTTLQDADTSLMIFSVAETIAFVSSLMTLEPGDIVATGTPAGVGFSRSPKVLLAAGDVVEVEVEGVGVLRNPIIAASPAVPGASRRASIPATT